MSERTRHGRSPTRLAVCMHEAGHAVTQLIDCDSSRLDRVRVGGLDAETLGLVDAGPLWKSFMADVRASDDIVEQWRHLAERDCVGFLAGPIAELKWQRLSQAALRVCARLNVDSWFGGVQPEARSDLGQVQRRLLWCAPDRFSTTFLGVWDEAVSRVATTWPVIEQVGRALDGAGELGGDDIARICEAHPRWPNWRHRLATGRRVTMR